MKPSIGATIDGHARPRALGRGAAERVAKRNAGRRGRPRKRRPGGAAARRAPRRLRRATARPSRQLERAAAARREPRRTARARAACATPRSGAARDPAVVGERPEAPWHPVAALRAADPRRGDRHGRRAGNSSTVARRGGRSSPALVRRPARHARVHDPRAPQPATARTRSCSRRSRPRVSTRRIALALFGARRAERRRADVAPLVARRAGLLAALQAPARALRGRAARARVRAASASARAACRPASLQPSARRTDGSGRSPGGRALAARLAGRAELLQARDLALAFQRARGARRAGRRSAWRSGLRSCSAKCGVEAPISCRTSSTVTSPRAPCGSGRGSSASLTGSPLPAVIRPAATDASSRRTACVGDLQQRVEFGLGVRRDRAFVADQPAVIVDAAHRAERADV